MKAWALLLFLWMAPALAHDVMGTVIYVDLGPTRVHLDVEMPVDELRLALGLPSEPGIAPLPLTAAERVHYVLEHLQVKTPAGVPFVLDARDGAVIEHDSRNWQRVEVEAVPPAGVDPRDFTLSTDVINHQVVSHHVFVFLRRDLAGGQVGEPVYLDTLHYQIHDTRIQREAGAWGIGFVAVFKLGMEHIASGTDHLLFLFTLLLPAGLMLGTGRRWGGRRPWREVLGSVLRIVTAFTIGHSLTLLLGSLGWARLPTNLVEAVIALSVMVSAAHAMVPLFPRREMWVALGFGLIHGLGFASALEGIGADGWSLLMTVLGFNLGVETMQMFLVALVLPLLLIVLGTRWGALLRYAGGMAALVMAALWFGERA